MFSQTKLTQPLRKMSPVAPIKQSLMLGFGQRILISFVRFSIGSAEKNSHHCENFSQWMPGVSGAASP
jgi:hypothetical protein